MGFVKMKKLVFILCAIFSSAFANARSSTDFYLENLDEMATYLRSSVPSHSFYPDSKLITGGWGDTYITLIKFNISSLPPLSTGDKVSIFFYNKKPNDNIAKPATINMSLLTSEFNSDATWNSGRPNWDPNTSKQVNVGAYDAWTELDITSYMANWRSGTPNYGIALVPINPYNNFNFFQSSKNGVKAGQKPFLRITWGENGCGCPRQ